MCSCRCFLGFRRNFHKIVPFYFSDYFLMYAAVWSFCSLPLWSFCVFGFVSHGCESSCKPVSGCVNTSIFGGVCVKSWAFIPLVWFTAAGQNNAIQYFLIYSNMDVTNNCTYVTECKTKSSYRRKGGVIRSENLFWIKYKDLWWVQNDRWWHVIPLSYSSLESRANQIEARANHSLDWFPYPAVVSCSPN